MNTPSRSLAMRSPVAAGPSLPVITLGLMVRDCADGQPFESVRQTVLRAFELGVTSIDLAPGYGGGAVEKAVGRILRQDLRAHRDDIFLATKGGWADGSKEALTSHLDRSLQQLGVEYVDLYYHHAPDDNTPPQVTAAALADLIRAGKTRAVGISNYSLPQTIAMVRELRALRVNCLLHQCNYNLINRWVEDGLLAALPALGVGAAVFTAMGQGLLGDGTIRPGSRAEKTLAALVAGIETGEPAYGRFGEGDAAEQVGALLVGLRNWCAAHGRSMHELALQWVLRHPQVTTVVLGASSAGQLEANVAAVSTPALTHDERMEIATILPARTGMV